MKIKNLYIKFGFKEAYLIGTENFIDKKILEKIADSAIPVPGDKCIYFYIFGEWSSAIQMSEKEWNLNTFVDSGLASGQLESIFKCDHFCSNCPIKDCKEREAVCSLPKFELISL